MHYLGFTWNPVEGLEIGSFTLRFYSLSYVLAFVLGWYIMKRIFSNENEDLEKLDDLGFHWDENDDSFKSYKYGSA